MGAKKLIKEFEAAGEKATLRPVEELPFMIRWKRKQNKREPDYWDLNIKLRLKAFKLHKEYCSIMFRCSYKDAKNYFCSSIRINGNLYNDNF